MTEIQEFELLCNFVQDVDPEVVPLGTPLTDPDRQLLIRIALGESNDEDRDSAVAMLCDNSTALEFLAQQLNQN